MNFIKRNSKNILIGILLVLFICACVVIFYLLHNRNIGVVKEITGKVIIADKTYLMIETEDNYLISNIKGTYEVGDIVKFSYLESEVNNNINPKQIKINDEELIEKKPSENIKNEEINNSEEKKNDELENNSQINSNSTNNQNSNTNSSNNVTNQNTTKPNNSNLNSNNTSNNENADTAVMNYMTNLQSDMDKSSLGESAKKGFITVVDFLFYNGTIKGYTFNELSNSVKLKVLSLSLYFDNKIEKYFPGYKESISNTTKKVYTNVKNMIVSSYLNITTSICENNSDICDQAKKDFQSLKTNFGLTFDLIKDIASDGINNLKNWYEIWSGK